MVEDYGLDKKESFNLNVQKNSAIFKKIFSHFTFESNFLIADDLLTIFIQKDATLDVFLNERPLKLIKSSIFSKIII
jgi:hypothetical protein